jgi:hypothetical protein
LPVGLSSAQPAGGLKGITGSFWKATPFSIAATITLRVWTEIETP